MEFRLNPPSGYADSYLDIEFIVEFTGSDKVMISLFNETSSEHLDILGVNNGYVLDGNNAVCKNCSKISGHINIFNDDKMNRKFRTHNSVVIRCEIHREINDKIHKEDQIIEFYNEAESLDAAIVPFDITIQNSEVDVENNKPLVVDVVSESFRNFELCIKSTDDVVSCSFEISAKKGKTTIHVPAEYMYYDLDLKRNKRKKFQIYYAKYQGVNFSRLANRKYILISKLVEFKVGKGLTSQPQTCLGPTNQNLNNNFMVSDRYLVPCPKRYSGLTQKTSFGLPKLMDLTMLLYESQDLRQISREIQQFASDGSREKIRETGNALHLAKMKDNESRPVVSLDQFQLMNAVSGSYDKVSAQYLINTSMPPLSGVSTISNAQKDQNADCLPCARKRRLKNAPVS